ncbi:family 43 glycosylhydrolase [Halosimplex amylolyticum]|uniref:family 43 glycosylhydrolase n=1 Tax=Halosimplex amylolyticum TaxID=3396616 RepID=UPI003F5700BE
MAWNPLAPDPESFAIEDAPAPLFRDPVFDGAADPSIMWHREDEEWWLFYTQRRSNIDVPGKAWIHGSEIGVATASDSSRFCYRGTLDLDVEPGHNTHWAPEILYHDSTYHLYVSYLPGVPQAWEGPRYVVHCTSDDCRDWTVQSQLSLTSEYVIDADVHRLDDGTWRMWYKDEADNSYIYAADSDDLYDWSTQESPVLDDQAQEAPIVFEWRGCYWLLTDSWDGLSVYRSPDGREWTAQPENLLTEAGARPGDDYQGGHPDVFVVDDQASLLYHVHQSGTDRRYTVEDDRARQTVLQVAPLDVEDGWLVCDRDRYHEQ